MKGFSLSDQLEIEMIKYYSELRLYISVRRQLRKKNIEEDYLQLKESKFIGKTQGK